MTRAWLRGIVLMCLLAACLVRAGAQRAAAPLDGVWRCAAETAGEDPRAAWARELPGDAAVTLPGRWHDPAAATAPALWYLRTVTLPGAGEVSAQLALDYPVGRVEVFFNGVPQGRCFGTGLPQRLTVRGPGGVPCPLALRVAPIDRPDGRAPDSGPGPLRLEVLPPVRIDTLQAVLAPAAPAILVRYRLVVDAPVEAVVRLEVLPESGNRALMRAALPLSLPAGATDGEQRFKVVSPRRWSPRSTTPGYRVRATLQIGGHAADTREQACGAVQVSCRGGTLQVNGETLQLRGARLPGRLPDGQCPPAETYRQELRLLQQAGFNAVMTEGAAPPDALLAAADALGMLVIVEAPSDEAGRPQLRETVEAFGHHPAVLAWSCAGAGEEALRHAQAADPGRLLFLRDGADSLLHAAGSEPLRCADLETVVPADAPQAWWSALEKLEGQHLPVLASALQVPADPGDGRTALALLREMVESLRRSREFALLGYFVRLPARETLTGLCTLANVPTWAYTTAKAFNQPCILTLRVHSPVAPGVRPVRDAAIIADGRLAGAYQLYQVVTDHAGNTTITAHTLTLTDKTVQSDVGHLLAFAPTVPGDYRLQLVLTHGADMLASTQVTRIRVIEER